MVEPDYPSGWEGAKFTPSLRVNAGCVFLKSTLIQRQRSTVQGALIQSGFSKRNRYLTIFSSNDGVCLPLLLTSTATNNTAQRKRQWSVRLFH